MTMLELSKIVPKDFETRAYDHFNHAVSMHPYFADRIGNFDASHYKSRLKVQRLINKDRIRRSEISACQILECERLEMMADVAECKKAQAIYEAYDAIAVLMRIISVLEGKQKLGKGAK